MIYIDFEYRNNLIASEIILVGYLYKSPKGKEPVKPVNGAGIVQCLDLRDQAQVEIFKGFFNAHKGEVWCCYNGMADITCLITLGCDVYGLKFIDLFVETNMVWTIGHNKIDGGVSLVRALEYYKIDHGFVGAGKDAKDLKDTMHTLILNNKTYTESEWGRIWEYGRADVKCLDTLLDCIGQTHKLMKDGVKPDHALHRGEFVVNSAIFHQKSKGFPVNDKRFFAIFDNRAEVRNGICVECNTNYSKYFNSGEELYQYSKKEGVYKLKDKTFDTLIENIGLGAVWKRTETGQNYSKESDYIDKMAKNNPALDLLYDTFRTLNHISLKTDLRQYYNDGYVKPPVLLFSQATGRSSPKPSQGFILNMSPWMRTALIHPHKGEKFIAMDWSQQEFAIAAILSGDKRMLEVYEEGDPYIALAIRAGSVPSNATKSSHPEARKNFKAVQLGISYGKAIPSLSVDIYTNYYVDGYPTKSLEDSTIIATEIYEWHKSYFYVYWTWLEKCIQQSRIDGFMSTQNYWLRYVDNDVRKTQLQNFPMQSEGAEMMRMVVNLLASRYQKIKDVRPDGLDLTCTLHDAFYMLSNEEHYEYDSKVLGKCMDYGSKAILNGYVVGRDITVYDYNKPYYDERGDKTYKKIMALIGPDLDHPAYTPYIESDMPESSRIIKLYQ
jgi:DNA polymerase I